MATKKERKFTEITSDFVKIGDGENERSSVEGTLVQKSSISMTNGIAGKYLLREDDGTELTFLGGADIDSKLERADEGMYVRISYVGKQRTSSGREMKMFRVEVAEE